MTLLRDWGVCSLDVGLLAVAVLGTLAGQADGAECEPSTLADVDQATKDAYLNIQLVDYPAAWAQLDAAENILPCVTEPVPAASLADYYLFRGLVLYYQGQPAAAEAQFQNALAVMPSLRWREDLGQRPRERFLDAKAALLDKEDGSASCPFLVPGASAYVDGREAPQGEALRLPAGVHLLQVRHPDGTWWGRFFTVSSGDRIDLPIPEDITAPRGMAGTTLQREAEGGTPSSTVLPPSGASHPRGTWPVYAAAGVSAVSLGAAALFGGRYWSTRYQLLGGGYTSADDSPEKDLLLQQNRRAAIGADVSLVIAGVAGAMAYGLNTWWRPTKTSAAPSFLVMPVATKHVRGMRIAVRFR